MRTFSVVKFPREYIERMAISAQEVIKKIYPEGDIDGYLFEGYPQLSEEEKKEEKRNGYLKPMKRSYTSLIAYPVLGEPVTNKVMKIIGKDGKPISELGIDFAKGEKIVFNVGDKAVKGSNRSLSTFIPFYSTPQTAQFDFVYFEKIQIDRILQAGQGRSRGIQLSYVYIDSLFGKEYIRNGKLFTLRAEEWIEDTQQTTFSPSSDSDWIKEMVERNLLLEVSPATDSTANPSTIEAPSGTLADPLQQQVNKRDGIERTFGVECPTPWWQ